MIVVESKDELKELINQRIKEQGPNCDLSDIDVSGVTDMSSLFYESSFNGDISTWDTSNVEDMSKLFSWSKFNGDISKWDVSNVIDMQAMFTYNEAFDQDISGWKINPECRTENMFNGCSIRDEYKPKIKLSKYILYILNKL